MDKEYKFTITGSPLSKANSRRIVKFGERIASIKSKRALDYVSDALVQFKEQLGRKKTLESDVGVEMTIYYSSRRPDLDPSIILDVMQTAGVYKNDRQVIELHLFKNLDRINPRSEILVYEL